MIKFEMNDFHPFKQAMLNLENIEVSEWGKKSHPAEYPLDTVILCHLNICDKFFNQLNPLS